MPEPSWLTLARKEIGTKEFLGPASNPIVAAYYLDAVGTKMSDEVPWCAAFVGSQLARAGYKPSGSLMARSYLRWGVRTPCRVGAVAVFPRGSSKIQGHVGFVVSFDKRTVWLLGGNQNDAVNVKPYALNAALGFRWPKGVKQ